MWSYCIKETKRKRNSRVSCMQLALLGSSLRKEPMKWPSQEAISLWLILHQELSKCFCKNQFTPRNTINLLSIVLPFILQHSLTPTNTVLVLLSPYPQGQNLVKTSTKYFHQQGLRRNRKKCIQVGKKMKPCIHQKSKQVQTTILPRHFKEAGAFPIQSFLWSQLSLQ